MSQLIEYPTKINSAVMNMAIDYWMLDQFSSEKVILFRSYGWSADAFTFGYTQKLKDVVRRLPDSPYELCRRPSGGGIVDHRNDWTYAVAVSSENLLAKLSPLDFYKSIHLALSESLLECGLDVELFDPKEHEMNPLACFDRPSPYDVVLSSNGQKVAGAALKRSRQGLLTQGSLDRSLLTDVDLSKLQDCFVTKLKAAGHISEICSGIMTLNNSSVDSIYQKFSNCGWNQKRL